MLRGHDSSGVEEGVSEDSVGEMWSVESCSTEETAAVEVVNTGP